MNTSNYYTVEKYLLKRFERFGGRMSHKAIDKEEHLAWKNELRAQLSERIGLHKMQTCALNPKQLEETKMDGYTRRKMIIETEPHVFMTFYILVPEHQTAKKFPTIIAPHGHNSCGKYETAGVVEVEGIAEAIKTYNGDYGVQLVKQGFVVLCPDARGFGERRERNFWSDDPLVYMDAGCKTCTEINRLAIALGQSLIAMWVWDLMRLVDFAETCPECDVNAIGCAGLSGGGMQTLWLTALDERIKAAVVSGYFYGFKESLIESVQCSCNYAPVFDLIDVGDLAALIAPRPLVIETGRFDSLNGRSGLGNVLPYVNHARKAYALFNKEDAIYHDIFEGEHRWNGTASVEILKQNLCGEDSK
jgi:dienelactone hydrolase